MTSMNLKPLAIAIGGLSFSLATSAFALDMTGSQPDPPTKEYFVDVTVGGNFSAVESGDFDGDGQQNTALLAGTRMNAILGL
jgi:hypothetical protein